VLLSDVEGLYDGAPDDPKSKVISNVTAIDDSVRRLVQPSTFGGGRGGMASKLEAARIATAAGESVILASGFIAGNLEAILSGEPVGTLFVPQGQSVSLRKRWIGYTVQPRGWLVIDPGAQRALVQQGRSLLPIGVVAMRGNYQKGDVVVIEDKAGLEIARGLTNYSAEDLGKIKGLKSDAIAAVLSHCPYAEVVHRDNLVVTTQEL
jgi:glutamate 5-kinase